MGIASHNFMNRGEDCKVICKAATLVGVLICVFLFVSTQVVIVIHPPTIEEMRRKLSSDEIYPAMINNIKPLGFPIDHDSETVTFWHVAKSGGTTVKSIYKCMRLAMTVRVGVEPLHGHDKDEELVVFETQSMLTLNVDTISTAGMLRAKKLGLVESGLADLIVTANINFAVSNLYDKEHRGRLLAIFRPPVDRMISKFYYIQVATWERSYHPQWQNIDLKYWAENVNDENNYLVRSLARVRSVDEVNENHLRVAQRTIAQRFVVGLMTQMEESIHRFNIVLGIDETDEGNAECMDEFFGHGMKKSNSNSHPKVDESDPAYKILEEKNWYDIQLYDFIQRLFEQQKEAIMSMQSP